MSIEELFFNTNITTGIQVAHGRGVVLLACQKFGVPIFEYTPLQVKQAVAGYGRADKHQVMEMTKRSAHLQKTPKPDVCSGWTGVGAMPRKKFDFAAFGCDL